ncbi:hypothetical protein Tco_0674144, partial [Tanacetum coccineum]
DGGVGHDDDGDGDGGGRGLRQPEGESRPRVRASDYGDRVDRAMRSIFGLGRNTRQKTFLAAAAWWPAAAVSMGKGLLGPKGGSCGGKGGRDGSSGGRGSGWLAKRSIVSNNGRDDVGLVVLRGKSSRESKNGCGKVVDKVKVVEL